MNFIPRGQGGFFYTRRGPYIRSLDLKTDVADYDSLRRQPLILLHRSTRLRDLCGFFLFSGGPRISSLLLPNHSAM